VITILGTKNKAKILEMEDMDFNLVAGYFNTRQLSIPQKICTTKELRSFTKYQFSKFGFYVGTVLHFEKRKNIDELVTLLEKHDSLLELENTTTIFNTMVESDIEYEKVKELDPQCQIDRGRNQLKVHLCPCDVLKKKAEEVGNIFKNQVFEDLGILEDKKENIVLSILETEASEGITFLIMY
jgi:hypothetical protein